MEQVLDPEDETVTHGNPYNFDMLNNEQSCNRSPRENDHKSQLVRPILMKPMVLEHGHVRLPQYKFLDIEE